MHIWIDAEIQCSGKVSDTMRCKSTFPAKVQVRMSHSSIDSDTKTSAITGIEGHPPEGWLTIQKTYFSVPHYFCSNCEREAIELDLRPV